MLMRKRIISLVLLGGLLSSLAFGDELKLQSNAPDQYVVVKGDTLWDISGKFLKQPWRWPEIWRMNRDQIKNPHWIYPGDVIVLDMSDGTPRLVMGRRMGTTNGVTRLEPRVRSEDISKFAVPSIAPAAIEPYLTRPLVVEENQLNAGPRLVEGPDDRVVLAEGEKAYATQITPEQTSNTWQIYRPGKPLIDPDTKKILGYEATYLGSAKLLKQDKVSTLRIQKSKEEIVRGDRLVPADLTQVFSYVPHAPDREVSGKIISIYGGVAEAGQYTIVVINRGGRDGLELGHVLALYQQGRPINAKLSGEPGLKTPPEQSGLLFIFRVFDQVSYGLILNTEKPVHLLDEVHKP